MISIVSKVPDYPDVFLKPPSRAGEGWDGVNGSSPACKYHRGWATLLPWMGKVGMG